MCLNRVFSHSALPWPLVFYEAVGQGSNPPSPQDYVHVPVHRQYLLCSGFGDQGLE